MRKSALLVLLILAVMSTNSGIAYGQGLIGDRYVKVEGGSLFMGDDPDDPLGEWDSVNPIIGVEINVPLHSSVDFFVNYAYEKISWTISGVMNPGGPFSYDYSAEANLFTGGFSLHFPANETVEMFANTYAGAVKSTWFGSIKVKSTDFTWGIGGGAEIALGEKASVRPSVGFQMITGDGESDNDGSAELALNYWILENVFVEASSSILFQNKDIGLLGGVGVGF